MANTKISAETAAAALDGTEVYEAVQAGANVKVTGAQVKTLTLSGLSVTLAQMANVATSTLFYRKTAGTGAPEVNTLATLKTDLGLTGTNSGDQTITLTGNVTGSGTGSFATTVAAVPAAAMPALTGDITTSAGAVATTLATNIVTYAKFQQVAASSLVGNATGSLANATGITLAGGLAFSGSTLTAAGALTPTSVASTGLITSSSATAGVGYATGSGGAVTQLTSKSTATPTINKMCGQVTMNSAALAAATIVSFTLSNSSIGITDIIVLNHVSGGTPGSYTLNARAAAGSATIDVRNNTAGSLSEAIVIGFAVIKGVTA